MTDHLKETISDTWKILTSPSPDTVHLLASHARGKMIVSIVIFELVIALNYIFPAIVLLESVSIWNMFQAIVFLPIFLFFWVFLIYKLSLRVLQNQAETYEQALYFIFLSQIGSTFFNTCLVVLPWIGFFLSWLASLYGFFLVFYCIRVLTRMPVSKVVVIVMMSLLCSIIFYLIFIPFVTQIMFRMGNL